MTVYESWNATRGAEIIAEYTQLEGATLVILHALQEAFGYVPEPAIPMIASALNRAVRSSPISTPAARGSIRTCATPSQP
jgi:NADH:ubiquinone oxidoreductase subunit E